MQTLSDTWIQDPSTHLIFQMKEFAKKDMGLLEIVVIAAEMDSVKHKESPLVNYFLAKLYQDLPEELSYEFRERIEVEKLREEGKEYILDMPRDSATIIENMGSNPTHTQGIQAATDYLDLRNMEFYSSQGNIGRAVWQVTEAIRRSKENPTPYKDLFNITFVSFMLDERIPFGNLSFISMCCPDSYRKK